MCEREQEIYLDFLAKLRATVQDTHVRPAPDKRRPGVPIDADTILRIAGRMFRITDWECADWECTDWECADPEPTLEHHSDCNDLGQRREQLLLPHGAYFAVCRYRTNKHACFAAWGDPHEKQTRVMIAGDIRTVQDKLTECITEFVDRQIARHSS